MPALANVDFDDDLFGETNSISNHESPMDFLDEVFSPQKANLFSRAVPFLAVVPSNSVVTQAGER